ncbi:MAG: HAD-IA family hydrolase [Bacteroidales bacterium]|nr:HAD-IA family hydrolase [Bacteroidales bacterium]
MLITTLADNYRKAGDAIHDAIREIVHKNGDFINCANNKRDRKDLEATLFDSAKGYSETFPIRALRVNGKGEVEVYVGTYGTVYTDRYLRGAASADHWVRLKNSNILYHQSILSIAGAIDQYLSPEGFRTVIFDLDGTLLDTLEDLGAAVNNALAKRGFPLHSKEEYRSMVGHGVRNLVRSALPSGSSEELVDESLADFKEYYTAHIDVHTKPYPGMQELVKALSDKGVHLAVASNKFQAGTEKLVAEFFPGIKFDAILGDRPGHPLKPDPAIVEEVLKLSGSTKSDTVFVGDSPTDMKTASNGGVSAVAVSWGYRTMPASRDYTLVKSAGDLQELLTLRRGLQ